MIPYLNLITFFALTVGMLAVIFVMLLPAIIELKKPKDAGPRIIIDDFSPMDLIEGAMPFNMEDEQMFDQCTIGKVEEIVQSLPNLET